MDAKPLTTADAGRLLKIGSSRVRQLIRSGRLAARKAGRDYLIDQLAIDAVRIRPNGRPKTVTT